MTIVQHSIKIDRLLEDRLNIETYGKYGYDLNEVDSHSDVQYHWFIVGTKVAIEASANNDNVYLGFPYDNSYMIAIPAKTEQDAINVVTSWPTDE